MLMRGMNLPKISARIRPPRPKNTHENDAERYEKLLKRNFNTSEPKKAWGSDITYVITALIMCVR